MKEKKFHFELIVYLASHCLLHLSENNGSSTTITGGSNTSIPATSTNSTNHSRRRSPVYNNSSNPSGGGGGGSSGRNLNHSGQKRRIPASHANSNSYVNNVSMSKLI